MTTKKKTTAMTAVKGRPGELTIPVYRQVKPQPDGTTQVTFEVRLDEVPIPERTYVADCGAVTFDGVLVRLLLGQKRIVGDKLRSLVIISIFPEAARQFLVACTAFLPALGDFIVRNDISRQELLTVREEPEQTVVLASNIIAVARAGREGSMDFYHASAASIHALHERDRLAVDPVLRVSMSIGLLTSLLDKFSELEREFPPEVV